MSRFLWGCLHNIVAHPLLSLTLNSRAANWLHDATASKAFPAATQPKE